jgi:signal transduction histidine kinase
MKGRSGVSPSVSPVSVLGLTLARSGEAIGGLFFGHPEPDVFTDRSEGVISVVAAQAAVAIDNAQLYEAAQREIAERKRVADELQKAKEELSHHAEHLEEQVAARTASLTEAISQLEEFSYSVSHDLRAPLRAISEFNRILTADFGNLLPPEAHVFLRKIARSAERMERLIHDVLTITRVARADIKLHAISLHSFIAEILEHHPSMQPPNAEVSVNTPHVVRADDAALNQAFSNLLGNAVKFVVPNTKPLVKVSSEQRGDWVRIWVEDQGPGIPPQHRGKLFGMFQRLPGSLRYEGSGIGLAIVRKAVERMGGKVGMEPNEPRGSRFWIELKEAR